MVYYCDLFLLTLKSYRIIKINTMPKTSSNKESKITTGPYDSLREYMAAIEKYGNLPQRNLPKLTICLEEMTT